MNNYKKDNNQNLIAKAKICHFGLFLFDFDKPLFFI